MSEDFILLNGDTLFEAAVLKSLLASSHNPITVAINNKDIYDTDDMKVSLAGTRLLRGGKDIPADEIHGESIGMILFRGDGPMIFPNGLEKALTDTKSVHNWYLSVIDAIAREKTVLTCSIKGLLWCEVDYTADLKRAGGVVTDFPVENDFANPGSDGERLKIAVP